MRPEQRQSRWLIAVLAGMLALRVDGFTGHPRVIVIGDIGNEPDDQMSLVRLLVYLNEFEIEALIASTSTWQRTTVQPETMQAPIHACGQVRPNLLKHVKGWPTAEEPDGLALSGQPADGLAARRKWRSSSPS